jgi:hypothetical protein
LIGKKERKPLDSLTSFDSYGNLIVTADLEAIITPEGHNIVYMAAWYNETIFNIFDISQYGV